MDTHTLIKYYNDLFNPVLISQNSSIFRYQDRSLYQILSFYWSIGHETFDMHTLYTLYSYKQEYKKHNINVNTMSLHTKILLYCVFCSYRDLYNVKSQILNDHVNSLKILLL